MEILVFNRSEKKYLLNQKQFEIISESIKPYMDMDSHNKNQKPYLIANIYYDTPNNELIMRSIDKPDYKEKLRLRCYGDPKSTDKVFFEIKKKYKGVVNKRRTDIVLRDAYDAVERHEIREKIISESMNRQVSKEINYMLKIYNVEPKVYLSYERYAYFGKTDDSFRLTFDMNIITRRHMLRLEAGVFGDKLLEDGQYIMEMKSNNGVPMWFAKTLSENSIYPISMSKYGTEYKNIIQNSVEKRRIKECSNQYLKKQQHQQQFQPVMQ